MGYINFAKQAEVDDLNRKAGAGVAAKRAAVKSNSALYKNTSWDLADAAQADEKFIDKVDMKTLPDSLQHKSRAELKLLVQQKTTERGAIQKDIADLNTKREAYIAEERKKRAANSNSPTLETEVEKIIKTQAKQFKMVIE
jgi:hypothetical protein